MDLNFVVHNIGQGQSLTYRNGKTLLLVDIGSKKFPKSFHMDEILNRISGIEDLWMILSSSDQDHRNRATKFLGRLEPSIISKKLLHIHVLCAEEPEQWKGEIEELKKLKKICVKGQTVSYEFASEGNWSKWCPSECRILSACCGEPIHNNNSIVLQIKHKFGRIMVPCDAQGKIEKHLLDTEKIADLRSEILVASHHGSLEDFTNTVSWLDAVQPSIICISHFDYKGWFKIASFTRFVEEYTKLKGSSDEMTVSGVDNNFKEIEKKTTKSLYSTQTCGTIRINLNRNQFNSSDLYLVTIKGKIITAEI